MLHCRSDGTRAYFQSTRYTAGICRAFVGETKKRRWKLQHFVRVDFPNRSTASIDLLRSQARIVASFFASSLTYNCKDSRSMDDEWRKIYVETKSKVLYLSSYNDKRGKKIKRKEREREKQWGRRRIKAWRNNFRNETRDDKSPLRRAREDHSEKRVSRAFVIPASYAQYVYKPTYIVWNATFKTVVVATLCH